MGDVVIRSSDGHTHQMPELRVITFGTFELQSLISSNEDERPLYSPVRSRHWCGSEQTLLKILLCSDGRQASKDALIEALWSEEQAHIINTTRALDRIKCLLSQILRTAANREQLFTTAGTDGPGYQLTDQQHLWVDADYFEECVEQASQAVSRHDDPLPYWKAAFDVVQGEFLPYDLYSEWAQVRRQRLQGKYRLCLRRLAQLYTQRGRHDEAEILLHTYIASHPTDQDALCLLLPLLGAQQRYDEAEQLYYHLKRLLAEEERQPSARTKMLIAQLRQQATAQSRTLLQSIPSLKKSFIQPLPMEHMTQELSTWQGPSTYIHKHVVQLEQMQQTSERDLSLQGTHILPFTISSVISAESVLADCTTWFGTQLAQMVTLINQWSKQIASCEELQVPLHTIIKAFDEMKPHFGDNTSYHLSRRQLLVSLATLPLSSLEGVQKIHASFVLEEFLPQCAASITACWHLIRGQDLPLAEQILATCIPHLSAFAQQPSSSQKVAAKLTAQGYLLSGLLAMHRNHLSLRSTYCQEAIRYSSIAQDENLHIAALTHLGNTLYYSKRPQEALHTYQSALPSLHEATALLHTRVYIGIAQASAQCGQQQEALAYLTRAHEAFPEHPEDDPSFFYGDYGLSNLYLSEGLIYLDLHHSIPQGNYPQQALDLFERVRGARLNTSERVRIELLNHQARAATAQEDLEQFYASLKIAIDGAKALGSEKRRQEAITIYKDARQIWPSEVKVLELGDMLM